MTAGQSGAVELVRIGDRAAAGAQNGVLKDVPADARVLGFPAKPVTATLRSYAAAEGTPALARAVKRLVARVAREYVGPTPPATGR